MKRPCRTPGCQALVDAGFCERCGQRRPKRAGSTERLYSYRWQQAAAAFRRRHPVCPGFPVGAHGAVVVASQCVDHVVPHRGNVTLFWDKRNWQALCNACHSAKTALEDGGFGRTPVLKPSGSGVP